jgi:alpha-beta hydrolase superfamily lysophospholipase
MVLVAGFLTVLAVLTTWSGFSRETRQEPKNTDQGDNMQGGGGSVTQARMIQPGTTGDFSFSWEGPLASQPIRVWYHAPDDPSSAQILMVMTGAHRDGEGYREDWLPLVKEHNTLLLVLEFPKDDYPGASSYNQGNILDSDGDINPPEAWTFNIVEALFEAVVDETSSTANNYALFGHSAGGQFVHRFMEFTEENHVRVAVAANAGWYTMPDQDVEFPHGLKKSPLSSKELRESFSRRLIIMVGADDIDPQDALLQRDRKTDAQGNNRLSRGLNFYQASRNAAKESDDFNWALIVVPGAAHEHKRMAEAAAPLILQPR